jgi:hypothetical protein
MRSFAPGTGSIAIEIEVPGILCSERSGEAATGFEAQAASPTRAQAAIDLILLLLPAVQGTRTTGR